MTYPHGTWVMKHHCSLFMGMYSCCWSYREMREFGDIKPSFWYLLDLVFMFSHPVQNDTNEECDYSNMKSPDLLLPHGYDVNEFLRDAPFSQLFFSHISVILQCFSSSLLEESEVDYRHIIPFSFTLDPLFLLFFAGILRWWNEYKSDLSLVLVMQSWD